MLTLRSLGSFFEACYLLSARAPLARSQARPTSLRRPPISPRPSPRCFATCRPSMPGRSIDSPPDRGAKRRRISNSPTRGASWEAMEHTHPTIPLTPIEDTLRTLLLDVAHFIHELAIQEGGDDVKDHPKTVLRFTGGWVRDKLLGVDSHDIDVGISNMTGYQFGMALKEYLDKPGNLEKYKRGLPNGEMNDAIVSLHKIEANPEKSKHLETVTTKIFGMDIDLVNLRKETYSEDSRNPQMEFGTAVEDALRRDATINALFYNLNESRLEDLTGHGLEDMKRQVIRTPLEPYQTFKDDPLRILRLIRFASRLGYKIDPETERAMRNDDISDALKLKISKERVGAEIDKMLHGPDPQGALQFIDRIGLYPTIFANHQDDAICDISTWPLAYNALARLLHPESEKTQSIQSAFSRLYQILVRDEANAYYAWIIAAFAPWSSVPTRSNGGSKGKPFPQRTVEVARDGLRADNKTITILRDATKNFEDIIQGKSDLLNNKIKGTPAEIRQHLGLRIRSWGKDWRLCIVLAMLQEVMRGRDLGDVAAEYDEFVQWIVSKDLETVCELKPIVNGGDIMKSLGAKNGPWMGKATTMVIEWQLLHPEDDRETVLQMISRRRVELGL